MSKVARIVALVLAVAGLISLGCRDREIPLGHIDEARALPLARVEWERAKELAFLLNTAEGPTVFVVGLRHSVAKLLGGNPDAAELEAMCSAWGTIWAQITWGPMTNRVYEQQLKLLPCGWYYSRSELEFNIKLVEELSGYKLGAKRGGD